MEFASYLAGERWSDHPACTHPVLAQLARQVNDVTSDGARTRLAHLIPSVIGLTSTDLRVDARIAMRAALAAVPVASEERQRTLAVALLASLRIDEARRSSGLAPLLSDVLVRDSLEALALAPGARDWAAGFIRRLGLANEEWMTRRQCQAITTNAIEGLALACIDDVDDRLLRLLGTAIDEVSQFVAEEQAFATAAYASKHPLKERDRLHFQWTR